VLGLLAGLGCSDSPSNPVLPDDTIPPVLTAAEPASGATDVALEAVIRLSFSEAINPATVGPGSFLVRTGFDTVPGVYVFAESTAVFAPAPLLKPLTSYLVTVRRGIRDPEGNQLARDSAWSFQTAAIPPPVPPR